MIVTRARACTGRSAAAISNSKRSASRATCSEVRPATTGCAAFRWPRGLGQCCGGVVTLLFEPSRNRAEWLAARGRAAQRTTPFVTLVPTTGDAPAGRLVVTACAAYGDAVAMQPTRSRWPAKSWRRADARSSCRSAPTARHDWFVDHGARRRLRRRVVRHGHVGRALVQVFARPPRSVRVDRRPRRRFPAERPAPTSRSIAHATRRRTSSTPRHAGAYCPRDDARSCAGPSVITEPHSRAQ